MLPRFEVADFAITLVTVFLFCAWFRNTFPSSQVLHPKYDDTAEDLLDDVVEPNPFEDALVADVFAERQPDNPAGKLADTMNSTLGFGKVLVISMPDRTDKRDAFSLQARLSNISFEVRDGVAGADVSVKALPLNFAQDPGSTGCWRAHLNAMQEMIRDNIQSALIFEDDADWDIALKYQMLEAAHATRFLTEQPEEGGSISPYGANWDIIWFGHCAANTDPEDNRRYVVTDDPTVLPPWSRSEFFKPDMSYWEEDSDDYLNFQTRIYFRSSWNSCSAAYAISLRGAEKVVFTESMVPYNDPVDNGMGAMCNQHILNFTCIAPFPTVVGVSKPAGASNRGSDIRGLEDDQVLEQGWSERLMFSTRQNIPRILTGAEDFISGFAENVVPPMALKDIGSGRGHGEWIWAGQRYFDQGDYQAAVDQYLAEADALTLSQEVEASEQEEWQNPIEQETGQTEDDVEIDSSAEGGAQPTTEQEIGIEETSGEEGQESNHEMEGHTPELP